MHSFSVELEGHSYRGVWRAANETLSVRSDYGSAEAEIRGRDPSELARLLLLHVVSAWKTSL